MHLDTKDCILDISIYLIDTPFIISVQEGYPLLYSKEDRLEIGRQIYQNEISRDEAADKYGIHRDTARKYMRLYRDTNDLPPKNTMMQQKISIRNNNANNSAGLENMTKEQLMQALMESRIREERLKKGYEMKGDGVNRTAIVYVSRNIR